MPEDNRAVLERAIERWNEGDLAGYLELYDANAVPHGLPGVEPGLGASGATTRRSGPPSLAPGLR